ncbi:MAG: accessory factor UbiK family protein [Bauldia sp.]|nr:accessory factor UbiK family protein [Bauldia sp.]
MTQTSNRFYDQFARLMNDAAGVAQGVRREAGTLVRGQAERFASELDLVRREDFEVVREMARLAREENARLLARIDALEDRIRQLSGAPAATADSSEAKSRSTRSRKAEPGKGPSGGGA